MHHSRIVLLLVLWAIVPRAWAGEIVTVSRDNRALLPHGKEADGMTGDWLIRNDKVTAVIGAASPYREANQMVSSIQGAVIDFTSRAADNDQLVVYYPQGARVDLRAADTILVLQAKGPEVQLKAVKYATAREPYTAETVYTLRDGESCLRVSTIYYNSSDRPVQISLSDRLRCDNDLEDVAPAGEGHLAYIGNRWFHAAYGVAITERPVYTSGKIDKRNLIILGYQLQYSTAGADVSLAGQAAGSAGKAAGLAGQAADLAGHAAVPTGDSLLLEPGARIAVSRYLLTGRDIADLQDQYSRLSGYAYKKVHIRVQDLSHRAIGDAVVEIKDGQGAIVSACITKADGEATLFVDKGNYRLSVTGLGHDTLERNIDVPESGNELLLSLQPVTRLKVDVTEAGGAAMPVKVEFRGVGATPSPYLGPPKRSNGAGNLYYSPDGRCEVALPPGEYDVILSHGPEYDAVVKRVSVGRGETKAVSAVLTRCFSIPHWIIADLHNHTTRSGDSNADVDGRIINMAAVGIAFAPATEHNRISDYTDDIRRLGLQKYIASAAGIELSGRPGPGDINHQTAFPLRIQDGAYGYGAPLTDKNPYVQMKRLYDLDNGSPKLMQHNHPNIGWLYFDRDRNGVVDSGFGTARITDVLEVREAMLDFPKIIAGQPASSRLLPWLQMLNLGYRIYGTANSDNHTVGNATGSMFNYIYTCCDRPENIDAAEIAQEVKKGHVVISNGPFLDVRIDGALPGDQIAAPSGKVKLQIKVYSANWCPVNTVQVLINGRPDSTLRWTRAKDPGLFRKGALLFEKESAVSLRNDAHIIVVVYGDQETIGMVNSGKLGKNGPIAMSNPVFVDTDGNGFQPNGDLLDHPVPVGNTKAPQEGAVE